MSIAGGYRSAQQVTRAHAKSFYFASALLFGARRRAAFALYAACRRLDDLVDEGNAADLPLRLANARALLSSLYTRLPQLADARGPYAPPTSPLTPETVAGPHVAALWPTDELEALRDTIERFSIPEAPFQDLVSGMEMDLTRARYERFEELDLYCYRVAGTVGLLLFPVLGGSDPAALNAAVDLGKAMQLTNILRDVGEDLARERIYLPRVELAAFGLDEAELRVQLAGRAPKAPNAAPPNAAPPNAAPIDGRWIAFVQMQVRRARATYQRAADGLPALKAPGAQRMVRLMGAIYGDILRAIEQQNYDVFSARAYVPWFRKVRMALRILIGPTPSSLFLLPADSGPAVAIGAPT